MSESILVTGGCGFIGSHLVDHLLEAKHHVTVLNNFNDFYAPAIKRQNCRPHLDFNNYTLVEGDIRDNGSVEECFAKGEFDEVIHLAAMAGVRPSIETPALYQEVNLIGTMNLLEVCRHHSVDRFIFASSSSVYGNNKKIPFSEDDPVDNPISPYASTKKSGELMVYTYHHLYGIKASCLRFFTVYGPRQRPEMAIHLFTDKINRGEEISRYGEGDSQRDYTYIEDIVAGIMGCRRADYGYEVINLGRSDTVRLDHLIGTIEKHLGRNARVKIMPQQAGDVDRTFADISKAKKLFGYKPEVSIDQGIEKFVNWYLEQQRNKK